MNREGFPKGRGINTPVEEEETGLAVGNKASQNPVASILELSKGKPYLRLVHI